MVIVYDLFFIVFCFFYFPYLISKGKWHRDFFIRLGLFPKGLLAGLKEKDNIWIHAVSVGEVLAVLDLIQRIKVRFPTYKIVLSCVTKAGYQIARAKLQGDVIPVYAPLDFSIIVRRYINAIKPKIYIIAETEIWPNLFTMLSRNGIPIIQINGRISGQSFKGYEKVSFFIKRVLLCVNLFCMQTSSDADRLKELEVPPEKIRVIGNLKFDDLPSVTDFSLTDYGFEDHEWLWIAGSTHPGEEEIILQIFKSISPEFPKLRLVIAPRHVERTNEVAKLIEGLGYAPAKFSQLTGDKTGKDSVMIVDTIGHLRSLYSLAKIVFVGKSLTVGGGHNIIEPAFFSKPVLVGPLTENFKDIVEIFLEKKAIVQVKDPDDLLLKIKELLRSPEKMERIGRLSKEVVEHYQGAGEKTAEIISAFLGAK